MREYVEMMHKSSARKAGAITKWRKVFSFRFGTSREINDQVIDAIIQTEKNESVVMILSTKGKSSLPSYSMLRGFELDKLRTSITADAKRCVVGIELRMKGV